jgi:hypothetical protein
MENIIKVLFGMKGVAPMKQDKWHGLPDPKTTEGYKKQAMDKIYRDEKKQISIPTNAIKACMRYASSELGKKMDGKKNRQMVQAGIFFEDLFLPIGKKNPDYISEDVVTRKGTGDKVTRVVSFRPTFNDWKCKGKMNLVGIPLSFAKLALELGGVKYGLLGHRPEFGRFIVTKFEEVK